MRKYKALDACDKAIEIKPKNTLPGRIGLHPCRPRKTRGLRYRIPKAIELKPDSYGAWNEGLALDALGRYGEALAAYEKTIELQPDSYGAWANKGLAMSRLGGHTDAVTAYEKYGNTAGFLRNH